MAAGTFMWTRIPGTDLDLRQPDSPEEVGRSYLLLMHQVIIYKRLSPSPQQDVSSTRLALTTLKTNTCHTIAAHLDNFLHRLGYDSQFWSHLFNVLQKSSVSTTVMGVEPIMICTSQVAQGSKLTLS
jgi:hypothetical protein